MYAELDITTNFSFLRGASHPAELVAEAKMLGQSALAVTDLNTLAGAVRAHKAAEELGIHLCIGSRLRFVDAPDVLVWAENRGGYANLCRLLTMGKRRAQKGECTLYLDDLLNSSAGLWRRCWHNPSIRNSASLILPPFARLRDHSKMFLGSDCRWRFHVCIFPPMAGRLPVSKLWAAPAGFLCWRLIRCITTMSDGGCFRMC